MRKRWILDVNGRRCELDADWDQVITSRGAAWVDGVEVARWWPKVKMPGIVQSVPVYEGQVRLVSLWMDFDIDLSASRGVRCIDPPLPPDYSPRARVRQQLWVMWIVLVAVVAAAVIAALVACFVGYH